MREMTWSQANEKLQSLRVTQLQIAELLDTCELADYWDIFADFTKVTMQIKDIREWLEMKEEQNA